MSFLENREIVFLDPISEGGLRDLLRYIGKPPNCLRVEGVFHGSFLFSDELDKIEQEIIQGRIYNPRSYGEINFSVTEVISNGGGVIFSRMQFPRPPRWELTDLSAPWAPSDTQADLYDLLTSKTNRYFEEKRAPRLHAA